MIRRIGNKAKLAHKIIEYFPDFNLLISPFAGSLAIEFSLPYKVRILANDADRSIINFFYAVQEHKQELITKFENAILHQGLFEDLKQVDDSNIVDSAFKFLYQSYTGLFGDTSTFKPTIFNWRKMILKVIDETYENIKDDVSFTCMDYKDFFTLLDTPTIKERFKPFIFLDPPYINTDGKYCYSFKIDDFKQLIDMAQATGIKWGCCEFNNPEVLEAVKDYNVYEIVERQTIKTRNIEIFITNYEQGHKLF